jgi:hypothetical protein
MTIGSKPHAPPRPKLPEPMNNKDYIPEADFPPRWLSVIFIIILTILAWEFIREVIRILQLNGWLLPCF